MVCRVSTAFSLLPSITLDRSDLMGYNFDYDYEAYQTVRENLEKLIKASLLKSTMDLALELMKSGSEQVEMSDEGLMTDEIEDCLRVVIKALKSADLPAETQRAWAKNMQRADRVDFICDEELQALAGHS
jgi:predicted component of type VI protein secretion system